MVDQQNRSDQAADTEEKVRDSGDVEKKKKTKSGKPKRPVSRSERQSMNQTPWG